MIMYIHSVDAQSRNPKSETLNVGSRGIQVLNLQRILSHAGIKISVNGIFDSATQGAVKQFQQSNGIEQSGIVDPQTWDYLVFLCCHPKDRIVIVII